MPAPPHPGRGGGPGKGPPLHRCCRPSTAGAVLGVEVGAQGHDLPRIQEKKTATPGLCSLARTGEGGLVRAASGLALFLMHLLFKGLEAGLPSKAPGFLWVWLRVWNGRWVTRCCVKCNKEARWSLSCHSFVCVC